MFLALIPKTEPMMIAPIDRIIVKQIRIMNLFLRYQYRLPDEIKIHKDV